MPRLARDEGIVLSARDHAETDRIVTLLTPGKGKPGGVRDVRAGGRPHVVPGHGGPPRPVLRGGG